MSDQVGLKYKLAARVWFTNHRGRVPARVVDASRDHVTITLLGGVDHGRTLRVEGDDIALHISRRTNGRY